MGQRFVRCRSCSVHRSPVERRGSVAAPSWARTATLPEEHPVEVGGPGTTTAEPEEVRRRRGADGASRTATPPPPSGPGAGRGPPCIRTRAGPVRVAFAADVLSRGIVGRHAMTTEVADLVLARRRTATWRRGHPADAGLVPRSGAGSQHTSLRSTDHLAPGGVGTVQRDP